MGQEQAVDPLDDLARVLAPERAGVGSLVDLDLVERGLDLPPLMVGRGPLLGGEVRSSSSEVIRRYVSRPGPAAVSRAYSITRSSISCSSRRRPVGVG